MQLSELRTNLKALMARTHINGNELARKTGIAQPIIYRLSTGQNTNPKIATLKPIAQYFMVTISQLIGEEALPENPSIKQDGMSFSPKKTVPMVAS